MKISVCMGIYNGAGYIRQQLDSIRQQTRQPEEVILCEDGSNDGTREMLRAYLAEFPELIGWKLYENPENKGYPDNFYYSMELCTGDLIFLSDQDDIWNVRKIERMGEILENEKKISVLASTFGLIDAENEAIHSIMAPADREKKGALHPVSIGQVFYKCEWPGMTLAFRRTWYEKRKKESYPRIPHDFFLCACAAEEQGFYQLEEILAYHRRHDANVGGEEHRVAKLLDKERKMKEIDAYNRILHEFEQESVLKTREGLLALHKKQQAMSGRYEALLSGKMTNVWKNARRNRKETRLATLLCDLLIVWR